MEKWEQYNPSEGLKKAFDIISLVNERFRENIPILDCLTNDEDKFESFFKQVVLIPFEPSFDLRGNDRVSYITFLISLYKSMEDKVIRRCALRALSLPIWRNLSKSRRLRELELQPHIMRHWKHLEAQKEGSVNAVPSESPTKVLEKSKSTRKRKKSDSVEEEKSESSTEVIDWEADWFPSILSTFIQFVESIQDETELLAVDLRYTERFLELLIDLLSQLPTRRFLHTLLDDQHVLIRCQLSYLSKRSESTLFNQLTSMLSSYIHFEVDNHTGIALSPQEILSEHNSKLHKLQRLAFSEYLEKLKDLVFSSTGELGKSGVLEKHFSFLSDQEVASIAFKLGYISQEECDTFSSSSLSSSSEYHYMNRQLLQSILQEKLEYRESQLTSLLQIPLIPSETLLWDAHQIPISSHYTGQDVLALPKLNLQFLTMHDYLLRNFSLFRYESAYEIREDLVDAIKRVGPRRSLDGGVMFGGWARMCLPLSLSSLAIEEVGKPNLGETIPAYVTASVQVDLSRYKGEIRAEWEALRQHDVVFLVNIQNPQTDVGEVLKSFERERALMESGRKTGRKRDFQWEEEQLDFPARYGVQYIRGGEIFEIRDEDNIILNDPTRPDERKSGRVGNKRKLRLRLDAAQYYSDMKEGIECYEGMNLIVRRKPKENNFRAVLETIRDLMNMSAIGRAVPRWLHDVFLGQGDPAAAHYRKLLSSSQLEEMDYYDTFLNQYHLKESFNEANISFYSEDGVELSSTDNNPIPPPYRLQINRQSTEIGRDQDHITVTPYQPLNMGPYPEDHRPKNSVQFTPVQIEAIRSGLNPGLTLVVGPPGTGKTDVATQIIAGLYRNHPNHKILVVAHSNAALNDLFEKIMQRNVDPRHLLRLGSGEADLREVLNRSSSRSGSGEEFSKQGRVNWSLSRRLQLLSQVQKLADSINVKGDVGYTCETASYFQLEHITSRIEQYEMKLQQYMALKESSQNQSQAEQQEGDECGYIQKIFPFFNYFEDAPQPLFTETNIMTDIEIAQGCLRHIRHIFEELDDYRAFELLRTQSNRGDYLLTKQARIVAMTCTHAAMTRHRLVELGFKYDSLVMEEAGQILEVETLIPMLLQDVDIVDGCRLKRVVLIGDHMQLPPVVKHAAFQKYSHLDQSLFTRFIRLGVPYVLLDKQGRARPEITALYSWRYHGKDRSLGNLQCVYEGQYKLANAGLAHTFQMIDVPDFKGKGEHCPIPFFYQNLGEAEYVVAVYQYMRLLGYPNEKISILSTYNGQTNLIRDILNQRCRNPVFGMPGAVSTVDKYQGQQNDYILLSLVRTESVGHLRDIRRLVVAASRARLGLYVFCRYALFKDCYELRRTFQLLTQHPSSLQLISGEGYPCSRPTDYILTDRLHTIPDVTAMGVLVYQMVQQSQTLPQQAHMSTNIVSIGNKSESDVKMTTSELDIEIQEDVIEDSG